MNIIHKWATQEHLKSAMPWLLQNQASQSADRSLKPDYAETIATLSDLADIYDVLVKLVQLPLGQALELYGCLLATHPDEVYQGLEIIRKKQPDIARWLIYHQQQTERWLCVQRLFSPLRLMELEEILKKARSEMVQYK